jgi:hypothetical protein
MRLVIDGEAAPILDANCDTLLFPCVVAESTAGRYADANRSEPTGSILGRTAMNFRRLALSLLFSVICLGALWTFNSRPSPAQQPERPMQKRCVGIATATLRTENPVITRVYRVFDDGSVETYDDGAPEAKWSPLGR